MAAMSTRESTDHQEDLEAILNVSHTTGSTLQLDALEATETVHSARKLQGVSNTHDKKGTCSISCILLSKINVVFVLHVGEDELHVATNL